MLGRWTTVDPIHAGLNWYVYVKNDHVNLIDLDGFAEIIANDIHGNPIAVPVPTQDTYLKVKTNIEIQRNSAPVYYNDILSLKIGNQTFSKFKVQSEADIKEPELSTKYKGRTLKAGVYRATLQNKSYSYIKPIQLVDDFYIHPNEFTTKEKRKEREKAGKSNGPFSQPFSAGCQIMPLEDFTRLTGTLESFGFEYNNEDKVNVKIVDDKKGK